MKKTIIILITIAIFFKPIFSNSQDEGVAAGVAALATIGMGIATVAAAKERAELQATEYILNNYPEIKKFNVKAMSLESGTKWSDLSNASVIPFKVFEFDIENKSDGKYKFIIKKRYVLMCYGYAGFINSYGVKYKQFFWELIDKDLWFKRMEAYVKASSNTDLDIRVALEEGNLIGTGVTEKGSRTKLAIEFYDLHGDSYIISDYSDRFKYIYNENSLGLFNKESGVLSQIKKSTILNISSYLKKPLD